MSHVRARDGQYRSGRFSTDPSLETSSFCQMPTSQKNASAGVHAPHASILPTGAVRRLTRQVKEDDEEPGNRERQRPVPGRVPREKARERPLAHGTTAPLVAVNGQRKADRPRKATPRVTW